MAQNLKTQTCEVTRPYWYRGRSLGVGTILNHDRKEANGLRQIGKVKFVEPGTKLKEVDLPAKVKVANGADPVAAAQEILKEAKKEKVAAAKDLKAAQAESKSAAKDRAAAEALLDDDPDKGGKD